LAGGFVAGVLARVAMRVVALATPAQPGLVTENGALVGQITPDGTAFVVFAGSFLGLATGLGYLAVRRWLPVRRWSRALASGVLGLCLGGGLIINAANPDFTRLGTPGLDIAVFAASFVVAGMAVSVAAEWLDRALPPTGPTDGSRLYLAVYGVLVVASVAFLFLAVIVALLPFWYLKAAEIAGRDGLSISLERGTRAWRIGRVALAGLAGLGLVRLSVEITTILATA
jgi:multisubunit Na+/H+ antiporter MnhB subunit